MFAPPVAKPKAKTASNDISPPHRVTPFGQRHGDVEQAPMFGPLPQVGAGLNAHGTPEQDVGLASMSAKGGPPRPSWNFCNVPAYLPGREKPFQMPPGLAPRLPIQAKLKVGAVDGPLEHEADRVADQVMRMPDSQVPIAAVPPQLSRKCAECEEEEKLQQKPAGPQAAAVEAPGIVHDVLRSPGQPLDAATRAYFEPRFGQDFSGVRVHTGAAAAQSARDVNANAYTVGHNVVFGTGAFAPGTHDGQRLIAHELTHVTQQTSPNLIRGTSDPLLQREPRHGQTGPREATVDVRWSEDGDRFYDRVVAALGHNPGFRGIDPDRFNYASNTETILRDLVRSFQSQYPPFYHHHPKEGESVKLHLSAYYDPHADSITNKKISFVEPPPSRKAPARAEEKEEDLPKAGETPEQTLRKGARITAKRLSRYVAEADRDGFAGIWVVIENTGTAIYEAEVQKHGPGVRPTGSVPVTAESVLTDHLWPQIEGLLVTGKGQIFVEFERNKSGAMQFQRMRALEKPKPGQPQPQVRPRTEEEELEAEGIPNRKKIYGEIFKETEKELKEAGIMIASFGVEQLILWVAGGLLLRALGFIGGGVVRGFPYLRRALSLGRKTNIARALTSLGEAEAAEFSQLMKGLDKGSLSAGDKLRLESLMTKVESALGADVPSLRLVGRIKDSPGLVREAENLGEAAQREVDDLVEKYLAGNHNPGIGTKRLEGDIYYLRGRNGGRVFYRETAEGYIEVLGKADKGNEDRVIRLVLDMFK